MSKIIQQIPNLITLANLLLGVLSIVAIGSNQINWIWYFLPLAMLLDFLDGFLARALQAYSELGKQLDSLADLISFGLVPALILYWIACGENFQLQWSATPVLILVAAAAYRLAKFNIDERQSLNFIGLPSPGNALFVLGILYWQQQNGFGMKPWLEQPWILFTISALLSVLMVSEIPMFSLKFKSRRWKDNEIKIIFMASSVLLLFLFQGNALLLIMLGYLALVILNNLWKAPANK